MLGMLLIIWKDGRPQKTYGVIQQKNNMRSIFLCIVIAISFSVCASQELEIYPGFKFGLSPERRSHFENQPRYPNRWPWKRIPIEDYREDPPKDPDYDITPERIRELEIASKMMSKNLVPRNNFDVRYYPRKQFEEAYRDRFRGNLNKDILDGVRSNPIDRDFLFKEEEDDNDDENGEENENFVDDSRNGNYFRREEESDFNFLEKAASQEGKGFGGKNHDEGIFEFQVTKSEAPDAPDDFAYAPPDPRFYETRENTEDNKKQDQPASEGKPKELQNLAQDIQVTPRRDGKLSETSGANENLSNVQMELHQQDGNHNNVDEVLVKPHMSEVDSAGVYIIAIVAGISAAASVGLIAVAIGWYNLQKHVKNAGDVDYPAYGVTGPNKDVSPSGDRRLAHCAQMYHYQHQKQQIIAMERPPPERHGSVSEADSDEENEEGDYTVYECPGLAPTGEMEVKNPLFQDDPTPAKTPPVKSNEEKK